MSEGKGRARVAGEVGPAIIGPMRRRKDGRWDWRNQSRRSLEAAVASWVVDRLEQEGHQIEGLWSPDYDRSRQRELATRPELAMTIDGEPAALDVTMFTTNIAAAAAARAARVRSLVQTHIEAATGERSIFGLVVYDAERVHAIARRDLFEQAASLADAFVAAVDSIPDTADQVSVDVPQDWIRGASLTVSRSGAGRRRASITLLPSRPDMTEYVDTFVAEVVAAKGAQLAAWGRGILVIVHDFQESATDVARGFARVPSLPWWRVYWVGPSPDHIHLVAG